jgi:hypothetical protein
MNFPPQLVIENRNEFRWLGTFFGKWFLPGEHWLQFLPLENGTKTRFVRGECLTSLGVGRFKLLIAVLNTRKGFIGMNESLKKEAEAKVTEKLVQYKNRMWI